MPTANRSLLLAAALLAFGCSPPDDDGAGDASTSDGGTDVRSDAAGGDVATGSDAADGGGRDGARGRTSLIDHSAWVPATAEEDPFDDRPAMVDCDEGFGWIPEELNEEPTVTVETSRCNYLTLTQPSAAALDSGDEINVRLWHFELQGSGEAHAAIQIGDELVWEERIPIPSDAELITEVVQTAQAHDAAEPVLFHLHNHGINTYNFIELTTP